MTYNEFYKQIIKIINDTYSFEVNTNAGSIVLVYNNLIGVVVREEYIKFLYDQYKDSNDMIAVRSSLHRSITESWRNIIYRNNVCPWTQ